MLSKIFVNSLIITVLCVACQPQQSFDMPQANVVATLQSYGTAHADSLVTLTSNMGTIQLKLYAQTPLHRANFLRLVQGGFYREGIFYRNVDGIAIQGGNAPKANLRPLYKIPMELTYVCFHKRGALAMASAEPSEWSSSSEFYIVGGKKYTDELLNEIEAQQKRKFTPQQRATYTQIGGYDAFDGKYTVIGEVVEGMDIVDKLTALKVYDTDKPVEKVKFSFVGQ